MKKFNLNRKTYEKMKKYDHQQMEHHCRMIYEEGYKAGMKEASPSVPDLSGLEERLLGIRGIGPAKIRMLFRVIEDYMEQATERK